MFPSDLLKACDRHAHLLQVSHEIHPDDYIFRFLIENNSFPSKEDAVKYYFEDGQRSSIKLKSILEDLVGEEKISALKILEFASGYGCVTRHLLNCFSEKQLTSCDIHPQAIEFLQETLGVRTMMSKDSAEEFEANDQFDVVFALSFFSHLPKDTFGKWIEALSSLLKPEGFLIFTTHGHLSQKFLPECKFDEEGFFFHPSSEQKDLETSVYGLSASKFEYVYREASRLTHLKMNRYQEAFWWGHQDLYILKNTKGSS